MDGYTFQDVFISWRAMDTFVCFFTLPPMNTIGSEVNTCSQWFCTGTKVVLC